jgi:hypothetical protein
MQLVALSNHHHAAFVFCMYYGVPTCPFESMTVGMTRNRLSHGPSSVALVCSYAVTLATVHSYTFEAGDCSPFFSIATGRAITLRWPTTTTTTTSYIIVDAISFAFVFFPINLAVISSASSLSETYDFVWYLIWIAWELETSAMPLEFNSMGRSVGALT